METTSMIYPRTGKCVFEKNRTLVMGILNVTPDSFSDGGKYQTVSSAVAHAFVMDVDGADVLDIGAESTRPGSYPVPPEDQMRRLLPVIEAVRELSEIPISVDTTSARVAKAALDAGADMINDVSAMREDPQMAALMAERGVPMVLMHMQGLPSDMQKNPQYDDVVREVAAFLQERRAAALAAGIAPHQMMFDPGFGFGKTLAHNIEMMARLKELAGEMPLLVGVSRKAMIGTVLDLPVEERVEGSLALGVMAVMAGAKALRVHDVRETVRAVRMTEAVMQYKK